MAESDRRVGARGKSDDSWVLFDEEFPNLVFQFVGESLKWRERWLYLLLWRELGPLLYKDATEMIEDKQRTSP